MNLYPGESFQLIASERNVKYTSSDANIVKVSADGKLTGVFNHNFAGHAFSSFYQLDGGFLTVNGPLVMDFTHALDYAKKIYGRKAKGLNVSARIQVDYEIISDVSVIYYDANGNEVAIPEGFDYNEGAIKAVRVKVDMQTAGVVRIFIDQYHTFDSLY